VIAALIASLFPAVHSPACEHNRLAQELAPLVLREARRYRLEPEVVVAVMWSESRFDRDARGAAGEIGLMQVKRGIATRGFDHLGDDAFADPALNVRLGVRYLARVRRRCGGDPLRWLGAYSGQACGVSAYATKVLDVLKSPHPSPSRKARRCRA
jgi:soluble lytic murein transglycosylase-like protein